MSAHPPSHHAALPRETDSGIGPNYTLTYPLSLIILAFITIALYNVLELLAQIFTTFKRRHGLYFYSILISTLGIAPYTIGLLLKFYGVWDYGPGYITLVAVGWWCMVTGQSVVLWSRLHLIERSTGRLRVILGIIVVDALVGHVPTTVLIYGANTELAERFVLAYSIYEKIQISIFFLQEVLISGIYVWKTAELLRSENGIRGRNARNVMSHLMLVNVVVVALDVTLLGIEYAGYYDIQTTYKAAVYSVKLKMEFSILNRLLELSQSNSNVASCETWRGSGLGTSRTARAPDGAVGNIASLNKELGTDLATLSRKKQSWFGNSPHAKTNSISGPVPGLDLKDDEVVKKTEVKVEREEIGKRDFADADGDSEFIRITRGMDDEEIIGEGSLGQSSKAKQKSERSWSATSSQVAITKSGS